MCKLWRCLLKLLLIALLLIAGQAYALPQTGTEAAVKTAFLFNFFKFIEWPNGIAQETFVLCMAYEDDLGTTLRALEEKTIQEKPVLIHRDVTGAELKNCHIIYITGGAHLASVMAQVKDLPIVTVSEQADFLKQGGIINLVADNNRLGFSINLAQANKLGLHFSAKLLKLAKHVVASE